VSDLKINMDQLRGLASDLKAIADEFKNADNNSEDAADATGDDELRDKVQDFADKWRIKRDEMGGNVTKLQGVIQSVVDTFTQVDSELAKALEGKAEEATDYKGYTSV
jgi:conjugal transfer/entry exclusion protein